jgi:deoxyribonucleoside regulator
VDNSKLSRRDLLVQIAKMYYVEEKSQEEISKVVKISRSNISRLLKTGKELGIVEIRINDISSIGVQLQHQLKERFGLKDVIVVQSDQDGFRNTTRLGEAAAHYLESKLEKGMLLGVAWGSSLYHLVQSFKPIRPPKVDVVQLLGGTGARNLSTDGMELARNLAKILGGQCFVLQAPLFVLNNQLREMILSEYDIRQPLEKAAEADIAVVGIGSNHPEVSALVRAGYLTREESVNLLSRGIVGDICGRQIDVDGKASKSELNDRIIGIELDVLKKIPIVIGVAAGENKADVILGALRGRYINVLVTDESAALAILNMERGD